MTWPTFTIILPHKRNPGNDAALEICLGCLIKNTADSFKLLMDAAYHAPLYERIDRMVDEARTQYCVILSSDIFVEPGWDIPMMSAINPQTFVTGVVVEPGAIGVHPQNLHMDFGRTPETFRRSEFETWARGAPMLEGEGWVVPLMFPREAWKALGGLYTSDPDDFPAVAPDQALIDRWKESGGLVKRVRSYAYHLQRWSDVDEQRAEKRR
jgi:hypothetical protein